MREIVSVHENMTPTHERKMTPDEILPFLRVNKTLCREPKPIIFIVDDVITEGAHFKAIQSLLKPEFPDSKIKGLFVARTQH